MQELLFGVFSKRPFRGYVAISKDFIKISNLLIQSRLLLELFGMMVCEMLSDNLLDSKLDIVGSGFLLHAGTANLY